MNDQKHILVLGVGNILLRDEGVGVRVVEKLESEYTFSPNVELMDGGTLGLRLLEPIATSDYVIVVDAVCNGQAPGTLYRLTPEELDSRLTFKNSLHQLNLVETLAYADMIGKRPELVIIGIEPLDISPWSTEMTELIQSRMPELSMATLKEIERVGGFFTEKNSGGDC